MAFRIAGLDPAQFREWFSLSDAELAARRAVRRTVDERPGYPCRISLEDAEVGEEVLLLRFEHHPVDSPYRAAGPIFVRRAATRAFDAVGVVPPALSSRLLSVRAWDAAGLLRGAEVCHGSELAPLIERLFGDWRVEYLHVHHAKPGCFACRVDRA